MVSDHIMDLLEGQPQKLHKDQIKQVLESLSLSDDFDEALQEFCDES